MRFKINEICYVREKKLSFERMRVFFLLQLRVKLLLEYKIISLVDSKQSAKILSTMLPLVMQYSVKLLLSRVQ